MLKILLLLAPMLCQNRPSGYSSKILNIESLKLRPTVRPSPRSINCKSIRISDSFSPVCGADNLTYRNIGQMRCLYNIQLQSEGACPFSGCTEVTSISPVCGVDGKTYPNEKVLQCRKLSKRSEGICPVAELPDCSYFSCDGLNDGPVCGSDLRSYENSCKAFCAGKGIRHMGNCQGECPCGSEAKEVCGKNGVTYPNECQLNCAKIEKDYEGACKKNEAEMSNERKASVS